MTAKHVERAWSASLAEANRTHPLSVKSQAVGLARKKLVAMGATQTFANKAIKSVSMVMSTTNRDKYHQAWAAEPGQAYEGRQYQQQHLDSVYQLNQEGYPGRAGRHLLMRFQNYRRKVEANNSIYGANGRTSSARGRASENLQHYEGIAAQNSVMTEASVHAPWAFPHLRVGSANQHNTGTFLSVDEYVLPWHTNVDGSSMCGLQLTPFMAAAQARLVQNNTIGLAPTFEAPTVAKNYATYQPAAFTTRCVSMGMIVTVSGRQIALSSRFYFDNTATGAGAQQQVGAIFGLHARKASAKHLSALQSGYGMHWNPMVPSGAMNYVGSTPVPTPNGRTMIKPSLGFRDNDSAPTFVMYNTGLTDLEVVTVKTFHNWEYIPITPSTAEPTGACVGSDDTLASATLTMDALPKNVPGADEYTKKVRNIVGGMGQILKAGVTIHKVWSSGLLGGHYAICAAGLGAYSPFIDPVLEKTYMVMLEGAGLTLQSDKTELAIFSIKAALIFKQADEEQKRRERVALEEAEQEEEKSSALMARQLMETLAADRAVADRFPTRPNPQPASPPPPSAAGSWVREL